MNDDNHRRLKKKGLKLKIGDLFKQDPETLEDLSSFINLTEQKKIIDSDTRDMLDGVLDIAEQRVRDVMVPRSQIVTLDKNQTLDQCLNIILQYGHSRYPVISEDRDHILGILLAKDLLNYMRQNTQAFCIEDMLRKAVVVPESKRVDQMLKEFRSQRYHMAIVIDEFGGVSGLVTIEDILELIVGDIEDEYDEIEDQDIRHLNTNTYTIRALTPIEEFNDIFNTQLNDNDVDTIGGLVMQYFGRLPTKGEMVNINNYNFKVTAVDKRRIIQLQVTTPDNVPIPNLEMD
ncbi:CNNM family magnesium/cobalt transport protein CorC [Candidatus Schmidhempelia bombi]|uniref:Magnesium and cobalt efflux protein CorC n=1 Tax=Candidatus Schmidhempelia bombi str. Bimp TaxID=1387197 RepID=A0AB94IC27_9GAMM|nr:CNNM family magnesium/cobalt transport protein CorC [Candidatus Schmidhempelia bombi]TEA26963.1 magnesium/cobalt transporter CorC [Candidatus Schmidhempelia bombi str. Bimp]